VSSARTRVSRGQSGSLERARPHHGPGDDQTVRHPSRLCHLARVGDSVTRPRQPLHTLFSDQPASPEEPHTFFSQMVLTSSSLLPVLLSLPPSLAGSAGLPVWFCLAFAYGSTISSSTSSLRIPWDYVDYTDYKNYGLILMITRPMIVYPLRYTFWYEAKVFQKHKGTAF
jgi:hypothetical protein